MNTYQIKYWGGGNEEDYTQRVTRVIRNTGQFLKKKKNVFQV